ncbi:DUF6318 family protein [Actinotalea sp. M2MS4P-6]|uniref:DUF6318 family protein n=1 Tax=Actinotalea sp. M2MS4P-6 TaxID=2983762 RepID=UPI0021E4FFAA|nr:DUF6318 family protein [Actinotalea sp. M2MS4P-6]MCV2392686.1 DUF6318 family protein [Actinotalea sp. M2MS4P-6]
MTQGGRARLGRAGAALAVVVVVVAVAGCGSGSEPTEHADSSKAAVTTAEASPSPSGQPPSGSDRTQPTVSPEMAQDDDAGAVAAARYFTELYTYATGTGDLAAWDGSTAATCSFCAAFSNVIEGVYHGGDRIDGGAMTVSDGDVLVHYEDVPAYTVQFAFTTGRAVRVDPSGDSVDRSKGVRGWCELTVAPTAGGWELLDMQVGGTPSAGASGTSGGSAG